MESTNDRDGELSSRFFLSSVIECHVLSILVGNSVLLCETNVLVYHCMCRYDVILTSETVYSRESYQSLHDVMGFLLDQHGVVYPSSCSGIVLSLKFLRNTVTEY